MEKLAFTEIEEIDNLAPDGDVTTKTELNDEEPLSSKKNYCTKLGLTPYLVFSLLAAVLGTSLMYGFAIGVVNTPYAIIRKFINRTSIEQFHFPLSPYELYIRWSLFTSLFSIGGFIGSFWFPGAQVIRFGRTHSLMYDSVIGLVGATIAFIAVYCNSYIPLMVGRAVIGIHAGLAMVIVPSLIVELAPINIRGMCGSLNEFGILIGVTIAAFVSLPEALGSTHLWNFLFLIPTIIYGMHGILMGFAAESPRWLVDQGYQDKALETLRKLRKEKEDIVQDELEQLQSLSAACVAMEKVTLRTFFHHRHLWWPLVICAHLHCVQQLSGIDAVQFYSTQVMIEAGLHPTVANVGYACATLINILSTFISMMIVDRVGRRILLLVGIAGTFVAYVLITLSLAMNANPGVILLGFAIFMFSFSLGPGPIPWFITAEMFTQNSRPIALSVCAVINWLAGYIVGFLFPLFQLYFPKYAFVPFAAWAVYAFIFVFLFLPDTSGMSSEQISDLFREDHSILQFRRKKHTNGYEMARKNYSTFALSKASSSEDFDGDTE